MLITQLPYNCSFCTKEQITHLTSQTHRAPHPHLGDVAVCKHDRDGVCCPSVQISIHHHQPSRAVSLDFLYEDEHRSSSKNEEKKDCLCGSSKWYIQCRLKNYQSVATCVILQVLLQICNMTFFNQKLGSSCYSQSLSLFKIIKQCSSSV